MEKWQEEIEAILKQKFNVQELKGWEQLVTYIDEWTPVYQSLSAADMAPDLKEAYESEDKLTAVLGGFLAGVFWGYCKVKRRKKADI